MVLAGAQLIDYGRAINPPFQPRTVAALYPHTPLIERLRAEGPEIWAPPIFAGPIPQSLGLRTINGYESLLPASEADRWRIVRGEPIETVLSQPVEDAVVLNYYPRRVRYALLLALGVNLLAAVPDVTPEWLAANWPTLRAEPIYRDNDGWIYRLPAARPLAYLGYGVEAVADERTALSLFTDRQPDEREIAQGWSGAATPLPADGRCEGAGRAAQAIRVQTANTITIGTSSACAGLLVLNNSWAPGWRATIDGRDTPVLRANYLARGVLVPAGAHEVRFTYAPASFARGLFVTSMTAIGLLALAFGGPRQRRHRPARRRRSGS